ncbi:mandelate racemase [Chelativorans sp. ZYF759]|uniref:mandelate racemase/muconate lactonizing enzyme family protein n=1 Tax=Chelativorans sp. ZYF759 TaxID=2692213 RepID=UPI00145EF9F3|nr:enolase C-terminal domain-like protein [Chelativorans sp. ZYF759]NMG41466.1 mandelate racemase [Chelativorans sp. ZYF759]
MRITALDPVVIQLPGRTEYGWRSLEVPIGRYVILRIETDSHIVGLGEAPAILSWGGENQRYFGEDSEIVCHLIVNVLARKLIGRDPRDIKGALAMMDRVVRGFPYTKAMIESALLDITGKFANLPVYQLLGGAARTKIPVCHSIGIDSPTKAADTAVQVVEDGIGYLQIKVPGDPATDLAIVQAVRKAVGDAVVIYPDINRGYRDTKTAINSIRAMAGEAGISAVEQPVEGIDMMAQITKSVDVPVIVDEGCWSPFDALEIVRRQSADIISIYYTKSGGLTRAMEIGAIGRSAGMPMNVNGSLEGGVGNAANLHLSAALEGQILPSVITINTLEGREQTKVAGVFYLDDVITEPFAYANGCLWVSDKPGLGVELDMDKIEKYRT